MKAALISLIGGLIAGCATGPCGKGPGDFFLLNATPQAKEGAGINYPAEITGTMQKDPTALSHLFNVTPYLDGSGAQTHAEVLWTALQCWGDQPFADALAQEPQKVCGRVLQQLRYETEEAGGYETTFPITGALSAKCL